MPWRFAAPLDGRYRVDEPIRSWHPIFDSVCRLFREVRSTPSRAFVPYASWLKHDLDCLPLVHRSVSARHLVEAHRPIKDPAGIDPTLEAVRQECLDVRPDGRGAATHHNIVVERWLRSRDRLFLRNADAAHPATRTRKGNCPVHRL